MSNSAFSTRIARGWNLTTAVFSHCIQTLLEKNRTNAQMSDTNGWVEHAHVSRLIQAITTRIKAFLQVTTNGNCKLSLVKTYGTTSTIILLDNAYFCLSNWEEFYRSRFIFYIKLLLLSRHRTFIFLNNWISFEKTKHLKTSCFAYIILKNVAPITVKLSLRYVNY